QLPCNGNAPAKEFVLLRLTRLRALLFAAGLVALGAAAAPPAFAQTGGTAPVPLSGHLLSGLSGFQHASVTPQAAASTQIAVSVTLRRRDESGFQSFASSVQNPRSNAYHHFASQDQLTNSYGPSQQAYDAVLAYLQGQGLTLAQGSANRLTLSFTGTRAQVEQAFSVTLNDYQAGSRMFYANAGEPSLPANIA